MEATGLWDSLFTSKALSNALAGAASDAISSIILHPVDTIKIRTQADSSVSAMGAAREMVREVIETGNVFAPWEGVESKLYVSPQQKLQYFYCYSTLVTLFRLYVANPKGRKPNTVEDIVIGYFAALQGTITTLPLSVVMTRQVLEMKPSKGNASAPAAEPARRKGFWELFFEIWREKGFWAFYNTWASSAILCINPALTYVFYEQIKAIRLRALRGSSTTLSSLDAFIVGAFAKAAATIVTFPLIRSQTLQRTWDKTHPGEKSPDFFEIFPRIIQDEGFWGLFIGLETQIFKAVINSALMLMIKEKIEGSVHAFILGK